MIPKRGLIACVLAIVLSGICAAQTASPDLVYVLATVTGPKKAPALGLKAENFQLLEDGVEQKITSFAPSDGVWDINVVVAHSKLLPGRADRISQFIRDAVSTLKQTSNPGDKIKVEELKFGSDGLYAAIDRNLVDLQKTTNQRRALVIITDGFDKQYTTGGNTQIDDRTNAAGGDPANSLLEYSKRLSIPIYFMYTRTLDSDPAATTVGARGVAYVDHDGEVLTNVAEQTGGSISFVDVEHQLESQCKNLAEELRNKYVLGFKSTNDKRDDKWRKLKVTLKGTTGPKLDVSAKAKYFVSKPGK